MDFKNNKPIFVQIAERICEEILSGRYPEGERLPSVREYASEVEVNVNTLVRSYDWLGQRDIISVRRGLGYYVSQGAADAIRQGMRDAFFSETLPDFTSQMRKLGITVEEVVSKLNENN